MRKYILALKKAMIVLCVCFLMVNVNSYSLAYSIEDGGGGQVLEELYNEQIEAEIVEEAESASELAVQEQLNKVYGIIEEEMKIPDNAIVNDKYMEYYGGAYINESNELVVCVTKEFDESSENNKLISDTLLTEKITEPKELRALAEMEALSVRMETVKFSYNSLAAVQELFTERYKELFKEYSERECEEAELLESLEGFGIDEEYNGIVISIVGLNDAKIQMFKNLFGDYEFLTFEEAYEKSQPSSTYKPGRGVHVITKMEGTTIHSAKVSVGYRAKRDTKNGTQLGFVSCGHAIKDAVGSNIYSGTGFKKIIAKNILYYYLDSVDGSFNQMTDGNSVIRKVKYSDANGNEENPDVIAKDDYAKTAAKGTTVYKVGATTFRTSSKIKNVNYTVTINGVAFTNQTRTTTKFCESGDSGGIVYIKQNSKNLPIGIIKGKNNLYSYYTKAIEVERLMKVYPY